jgi:AraC-like DNA-binding protein
MPVILLIFMKKQYEPVFQEITPLSSENCFYIADRHKTKFTYPIHSHVDFELNFILNAAGVKRTVGDSIEVVGAYDLVLITSENLEHVWENHECVSENIREITIQFSPDLFFDTFLQKNQFSSIRHMLELAQKGLAFPVEAIMKVFHLLDTLASCRQGFYAVIRFLEILYELSLCVDEAKVLSSSSFAKVELSTDSRRIGKVQGYINEHYRENITLCQLAEMVGMTPGSFSRFFKLHTGKSPIDYIIDTRLGSASRLLVDSSQTITEICFECGFNNISNFNRIFRKNKTCTPKEFRENYKKKTILV